ncbi:hypothetical protein BOTBODRAFT_110638 [Botryobasidium botryosum FD-172 SS1]|uniref:Serine hydrolase domain-containing protein n=1 Tax=Botryobasidium botryosum (strain FD-172 SS1) TaxID=930990 RepID=A0A067MEI0_BOTB1|nr:hypothetical protein BOTBODRAFT_110638 [Botryobasidium botryosum FD-172 SS1]
MATRRILALHGYSQNRHILSQRMSAITKLCKDCEFVFADAPHVLDAVTPQDYRVFDPAASAGSNDPKTMPRAWFRIDPKTQMYTGLERSVIYLRDMLAQTHFHGVFGFSQGTAMASIICAILERPHLYPSFLIDGVSPHPPLDFAIFVSGLKPYRHESLPPLFSEPLNTRTLHVIGRNDVITTPERSQALIDAYVDPRVEYHDGGHFIPAKTNWRNFFASYIASTSPYAGGMQVPPPVPKPLTESSTTSTPAQPLDKIVE